MEKKVTCKFKMLVVDILNFEPNWCCLAKFLSFERSYYLGRKKKRISDDLKNFEYYTNYKV